MTDIAKQNELVEAIAKALADNVADEVGVPRDMVLPGNRRDAQAALAAIEANGLAVVQGWQGIESAPKGATPENPTNEHWILGFNGREQRVMRWCMEYPRSEGCWMFAYEPSDYIDGIQEFYPTHWMPLPASPLRGEG